MIRYLSSYNCDKFKRILEENYPHIENACHKELAIENINGALYHINKNFAEIYRICKEPRKIRARESTAMNKASESFDNLKKCLNGENNQNYVEALQIYKDARSAVSTEVLQNEN